MWENAHSRRAELLNGHPIDKTHNACAVFSPAGSHHLVKGKAKGQKSRHITPTMCYPLWQVVSFPGFPFVLLFLFYWWRNGQCRKLGDPLECSAWPQACLFSLCHQEELRRGLSELLFFVQGYIVTCCVLPFLLSLTVLANACTPPCLEPASPREAEGRAAMDLPPRPAGSKLRLQAVECQRYRGGAACRSENLISAPRSPT